MIDPSTIDLLPKERTTADTLKPEHATEEMTVASDTLETLFQDRDTVSGQQSPKEKSLQEKPAQQPNQTTSAAKADPAPKADPTQKTAGINTPTPEATRELQTLKEELEKTHKRLTENQQYGRQNAQRLKNALKITRELVEEGSLSDEEALKLQDSLQSDAEEDDSASPSHSHLPSHPFGKVLAAANKELEFIRKYTNDERLDDKVGAFDYFLLVAPTEEREQALEDLTDLMDTPLKLAKKMLSIGQGYEKSYREMKAAGGIQGMIAKKDQDIDNLHKSIDKLTKKLAQYEDYDKPRYRLDESVGDPGESEEEASSKDTITSLFSHRDRGNQR